MRDTHGLGLFFTPDGHDDEQPQAIEGRNGKGWLVQCVGLFGLRGLQLVDGRGHLLLALGRPTAAPQDHLGVGSDVHCQVDLVHFMRSHDDTSLPSSGPATNG